MKSSFSVGTRINGFTVKEIYSSAHRKYSCISCDNVFFNSGDIVLMKFDSNKQDWACKCLPECVPVNEYKIPRRSIHALRKKLRCPRYKYYFLIYFTFLFIISRGKQINDWSTNHSAFIEIMKSSFPPIGIGQASMFSCRGLCVGALLMNERRSQNQRWSLKNSSSLVFRALSKIERQF